ncbi:MAG: hypothetical protein IPG68_02405 [Micrococcales bacterium]|nr:hypothetical protein [Micrococcales bacterium]
MIGRTLPTVVGLAVLGLAGCGSAGAQPAVTASASGPTVQVAPGAVLTGPATLAVTGRGFDERKGIYVAFCVQPPAGEPPSPCGGGVDTTGESGASAWVSSDPPPYGAGLAVPYGPGGSFDVQIRATAHIGDVDCREMVCGVAARADHTRTTDRTQDVFIPITFEEK